MCSYRGNKWFGFRLPIVPFNRNLSLSMGSEQDAEWRECCAPWTHSAAASSWASAGSCSFGE